MAVAMHEAGIMANIEQSPGTQNLIGGREKGNSSLFPNQKDFVCSCPVQNVRKLNVKPYHCLPTI